MGNIIYALKSKLTTGFIWTGIKGSKSIAAYASPEDAEKERREFDFPDTLEVIELTDSKPTKVNYWQVVGWNNEATEPECEATVSSLYEDFDDAREAMIGFVREDGLIECIDKDINLEDKELNCITVNGGNRGYYLQNINFIVRHGPEK